MQTRYKCYLVNWVFLITIIFTFSCTDTQTFQLKNGDLLFQDLDSSPLCDAIEKVTSGFDNLNFSHIGIVVIFNENKYVLEAFVNGVDTVPLESFLKRSLSKKNKPKVLVGRLKNPYTKLIPEALKIGMELTGKKYDEEFKINNDKFYCSELIYDIFWKANKQKSFFHLQPMTYKYNGEIIDIWIDYFNDLGIAVPENEPGINPGSISLSDKIDIVYNYNN